MTNNNPLSTKPGISAIRPPIAPQRRALIASTAAADLPFSNQHSGIPLLVRHPSISPSALSPLRSPALSLSEALGLDGYKTVMNWLLIFMVLGLLSSWLQLGPITTFLATFIGMIPLGTLMGKATEDIAGHTNDTIGALVNVTFGNAVELILSISAMRADRITLIEDTIAGSVLSNLLLVLGSSFFVGGVLFKEQRVNDAVAENNANMLLFAVFGFTIPALFAVSVPLSSRGELSLEILSLLTAIFLLSLYIMFMVFQLHTHADLYETQEDQSTNNRSSVDSNETNILNANIIPAPFPDNTRPTPSLTVALGVLVFTVIFVTLSSEVLVDSLDAFSHKMGLGEKFIAIVLLPVVANSVEHMSAIMVAGKDKIDMSIGIACGSSLQMALFVAPLLVLLSWIFGYTHICLSFQLFETICLGFTVLLVNATLRDSRTNWLEGALLLMCYFIVITAFYFIR